MVAPTLTAEQYQYEDTGILLNGPSTLPFVDITSVDGLDSTNVRQSTTAREGLHGSWIDAEFEEHRAIQLQANIYANPNTLDTYLDSLKANFAPSASARPFYFGTDATPATRMVYGKSLGLKYPKDNSRNLGVIPCSVQILCEDPRIFAVATVTQALPGTLTLLGNRDTHGIITIAGPRTNPTITLGSTTFTFAYTLLVGNSITIDLNKRLIILNGSSSIRTSVTLTGLWPKLNPGANVFTVGGTGAGAISISAQSAWR